MSDKISTHEIFNKFINSFLSTVNKHAPLKKLVDVKKTKTKTMACSCFD